ncbi:hypothetical protein WA158_000454 [Blastocystis sp. Blastoise]
MPNVPVERDLLFKALGKTFTDEEFDKLCFEYGIELDEIVTEKKMKRRLDGDEEEKDCVVYKIDVAANRPDLLCLEGLVQSLKVFLRQEDPPIFKLTEPKEMMTMTVKPHTKGVRPYVCCAVLRNLKFDHEIYNNFLDLQDKLHFNIGRRRNLVAIGTHDLDTIEAPFIYDAREPETVNFVPLNQTRSFNCKELMDYYRDPKNNDCKHLTPYTDLVYNEKYTPCIFDKNDVLLSFPPLINGNHSKMCDHSKNIFIECTGKDLTKVNITLNTIIALFSQYCEVPFSVEPVKVIYEPDTIFPEGATFITPDLTEKRLTVNIDECNSTIGVDISPETVVDLLTKMQLRCEYTTGSRFVTVDIPITRSDIIHPVDVYEDVAIAYGYNNIKRQAPPTNNIGSEQPVNHLSDMLRAELANAGYRECLTLALCSWKEEYDDLLAPRDHLAVSLSNPKTIEFEVCRTSLLPGLLKTLRENKNLSFAKGIKIFEISDVILQDHNNYAGARNERHLSAVYCGNTAAMEIIHGLMDRIMKLLDIYPAQRYSLSTEPIPEGKWQYYIRASSCPTYYPNRSCEIVIIKGEEEEVVGTFGVLHPKVLKNFSLVYPGCAIEMNLTSFIDMKY